MKMSSVSFRLGWQKPVKLFETLDVRMGSTHKLDLTWLIFHGLSFSTCWVYDHNWDAGFNFWTHKPNCVVSIISGDTPMHINTYIHVIPYKCCVSGHFKHTSAELPHIAKPLWLGRQAGVWLVSVLWSGRAASPLTSSRLMPHNNDKQPIYTSHLHCERQQIDTHLEWLQHPAVGVCVSVW